LSGRVRVHVADITRKKREFFEACATLKKAEATLRKWAAASKRAVDLNEKYHTHKIKMFNALSVETRGFLAGEHPGVKCDASGQCPIVGNRYKRGNRVNKKGYNLCEAEYLKLSAKARKVFVKIPPPPAWPSAEVACDLLDGGSALFEKIGDLRTRCKEVERETQIWDRVVSEYEHYLGKACNLHRNTATAKHVTKKVLAKRMRCDKKLMKSKEEFQRKAKHLSEHLSDVLAKLPAELKSILKQVAEVQRKFHLQKAAMADEICAKDAAGLGRWKVTENKSWDASAPATFVRGKRVVLEDMFRKSRERLQNNAQRVRAEDIRREAAAQEAEKKRRLAETVVPDIFPDTDGNPATMQQQPPGGPKDLLQHADTTQIFPEIKK